MGERHHSDAGKEPSPARLLFSARHPFVSTRVAHRTAMAGGTHLAWQPLKSNTTVWIRVNRASLFYTKICIPCNFVML
jgi:hypothetical protein